VDPQNWSGYFEEDKYSLPLPGIEKKLLARRLVSIPTTLHQLPQ